MTPGLFTLPVTQPPVFLEAKRQRCTLRSTVVAAPAPRRVVPEIGTSQDIGLGRDQERVSRA